MYEDISEHKKITKLQTSSSVAILFKSVFLEYLLKNNLPCFLFMPPNTMLFERTFGVNSTAKYLVKLSKPAFDAPYAAGLKISLFLYKLLSGAFLE